MNDNLQSITKVDKGRALHAFNKANNAASKNYKKEYKQYSMKLISMIRVNGLAPALAFIFSKNDQAYNAIAGDIIDYLKVYGFIENNINDLQGLIQKVISLNSAEYFMLTGEITKYLSWLSRFIKGMVK